MNSAKTPNVEHRTWNVEVSAVRSRSVFDVPGTIRTFMGCGAILWLAAAFCLSVQAQSSTVTIQANQPGAVISSNLFGIFFEEINSAGDGGIYAELVRNRSFEDSTNSIPYWTFVTNGIATGRMSLDSSAPLNATNPQCLKLTMTGGIGTVGAANSGYWGIPLTAGATYNLGFYARASSGFNGAVRVSLESTNGSPVYAYAEFTGLTTNWQHFSASLVPSATDPSAQLALRIFQTGSVYLDFVSLFPAATFDNRTNGLRPDLANMLVNLKPSFMRFPGGSWVNGMNLANAYHWEPTVGDPAARPERANIWGYMVSNGLGYEEYLQMCEDLGAAPLFCINAGMDVHQNAVPTSQLGPWVQEALDAIQYANGDTNTYWGAQRAANGHPAPFNLRYIEIGNENGGSAYNANYAMFYDAIKTNYPHVHIIADNWGGIPSSRPVEIMDEHYYNSPAWFIANATRYDTYSRTGPKVFVGEYAVTSGSGNGNLAGALGEAAFMTGLERNSDIVEMASYAPLFANLNNKDWNPDLIYFNGTQVYGTPSYYVQQMFSLNRGSVVLPTAVQSTSNGSVTTVHGAIGVGSWNTSVQYTNIVVTSNGVTLYQSNFASGAPGWNVYNGNWSAQNGLYQQTAITTDCRSTTGDTNWANYTLTLQARKVSGNEGFLILFNWLDDNDWTWWNIGGWNNTLDGIEQMSGGSKSLISPQIPETINAGQWYDIRVVLTGPRIQCYLNGQLVQDVTYPNPSGVLVSSSYADSNGDIIVKAVNPYNQATATTFNIQGANSIAPDATLIQLTGNPADENSFADPTNVFPVTNAISDAGTNFTLTLPANSLSILRLRTGGLDTYTNLELQIASPLTVGQTAVSELWAWAPGLSNPVNLTTNTTHAITWSSANPNVAVVDISGNVTGADPGTTAIVATYAGLGLSATQLVQVVGVPNGLAHRYSFNDAPGSSTVADSVGGAAWNGTLPNGGTLANGELTLSSASKQYIQLPAGILSNDAAVTIEAWVTFPGQLPVNCFFYGFGNTDSSGNGEDYIFCAPQGGRIAITAADPGYTGEQNAEGAGDLSYSTNLHFVAVYDPPAGYLALYTNGVLAAVNNSVTVPMNSVNDVLNYVGRSLYNQDPYPDLVLDEFRIYRGALTPRQIAATQALGPNQLLSQAPPIINASLSGGNLTVLWPLASAGFELMSRTNLASGVWLPVSPAPIIVGNQWQARVPVSGTAQYFRLQE